MKKVLILGGGYAGVNAALTLCKNKKKSDDIEITLIDKNDYHTLLTEIHAVAGGRIDPSLVQVPLRDIFKNTPVKLIKDDIINVDFENKELISAKNKYQYDYLIAATGSDTNYYGIAGLQENAYPLWSIQEALAIKSKVLELFQRASVEKDPKIRKNLLTLCVCGGGATGVELIGEFAHWRKSLCKEFGINPKEVTLIMIEMQDKLLPQMHEKISFKTAKHLEKRLKIEVQFKKQVKSYENNIVTMADGSTIDTELLVWTAGIKGSCICDNVNVSKNKTCRIQLNSHCKTEKDDVYAAGDMSIYENDEQFQIQNVESALITSKCAAKNILADIRKTEKQEVKLKFSGAMVSLGFYYGVTELFGLRLYWWFAMAMKHMILWHYLFEIGGFGLVIKQFKDEFYYKKHNACFIEKHFTPYIQNFWVVPLRLYLGFFWLVEALSKLSSLEKTQETNTFVWFFDAFKHLDFGWFKEPILTAQIADSMSGASPVAEGGKVLFPIVSEHSPYLYQLFATSVIEPNAVFFQIMIVLTEIFLGLAFLSGAFTFIAGLVSLGMCANFLLGTGMYPETWWIIPAQIALLSGAGRSFGLDYYIIPYVREVWRVFWVSRKIKLFPQIMIKPNNDF